MKSACFPVVMTTHNRTRVASYVLEKLIDNVRCGVPVLWIVSDDESPAGHVEALEKILRERTDGRYRILRTSDGRRGLGAALNNGLREAFAASDVCARVEDDWVLQRPLDFDEYISALEGCADVGGIRLGTGRRPYREYDRRFRQQMSANGTYVFNNQVMAVHRRIYDRFGYYPENCSPDRVEASLAKLYNEATRGGADGLKVLFPKAVQPGRTHRESLTFMDNPFVHVGKSTHGGRYSVPGKYRFLYEDGTAGRKTGRKAQDWIMPL